MLLRFETTEYLSELIKFSLGPNLLVWGLLSHNDMPVDLHATARRPIHMQLNRKVHSSL